MKVEIELDPLEVAFLETYSESQGKRLSETASVIVKEWIVSASELLVSEVLEGQSTEGSAPK